MHLACICKRGAFLLRYLSLRLQMLLCVAIVISVSPSCVSVTPNRVSSSSLSRQASALAMAVTEVVNSQEFTSTSPLLLSYERKGETCAEQSAMKSAKAMCDILVTKCVQFLCIRVKGLTTRERR